MRIAYLDHQATTPLDSRVLDRMMPFLTEQFGNASSQQHSLGWFAAEAVEVAREQVAALLGATPHEIVFTSGATESNNMAILGTLRARVSVGAHVVTQATEHKAVLDVVAAGSDSVTILPVNGQGWVDPEDVIRALRKDTVLVSIMHANNEVGTIQDLDSIGAACRERGIWFHTDAAQTVGKLSVDLKSSPIDLLSLSAHKLYGPKGVGALYMRRRSPRVKIEPLMWGGGHERGIRSGTLNVAGIAGLGAAAEFAGQELAEEQSRVRSLRDRLEAGLRASIPEMVVHGSPERLFNNLNVSLPGVAADALLLETREVAASTGSACTSASRTLSHVLRAMGLPDAYVSSSVRLSPGRGTCSEDIDLAIEAIVRCYRRLTRRGL